MMAGTRRGVAVSMIATLLQLSCRCTVAQIYSLADLPAPPNRSLHILYAFYVYSHEEAPDKSVGQPFVKFHGMSAKSSSPYHTSLEMQGYKGVQLSIMKYKHFWELINPKKFCCTQDDVQAGLCQYKDQLLVQKPAEESYDDVDVYLNTIKIATSPSDIPTDVKMDVRRTGEYILVLSNCGGYSDATVTGSVVVKNSYGFLPGNEYHKMPFYGWLLLIYVVLAVLWMVLSLRWWKELFNIQHCISAVVFFGLVEVFAWWIFYNDWNSTGSRGKFLFVVAILFSVAKSIFSYMLVLVASLGWGVTRPYLDKQTLTKIQAVSFLYIVLDFIRQSVLSFRHSHSLPLTFVLLCLLPVSLLNGGIFYWVFTALSGLMETLKERCQTEKLILFQRLWRILILALSVATMTLLAQIFDLSRSITTRWKYQWMFVDGVSHMLFLVVLAAMMFLWAPHSYSQRYAYSLTIDDCERDKDDLDAPGQAVWADEDGPDDDGDDGESFWASTKGETSLDIGGGPTTTIGRSGDVIGSLEVESQSSDKI